MFPGKDIFFQGLEQMSAGGVLLDLGLRVAEHA